MEAGKLPVVQLPVFQGPLDLLLQLIQAEKVDIYDIPIARITDQFLEALQQMKALDMEVTSEFLVLAAQLLYIKSRYLLPKPVKEEGLNEGDPRQELVERLVTYRAYKEASEFLASLQTSSGQRFFRDVDIDELLANVQKDDPLQGVSFADLWQSFRNVIERAERGEEIQQLKPEEIEIEEMVQTVWRRVLLHPEGLGLHKVLRTKARMELIVAFLALLELLKNGRVRAEQATLKSEIMLFPAARAWEFREEGEVDVFSGD